jgi:hypothetical protein
MHSGMQACATGIPVGEFAKTLFILRPAFTESGDSGEGESLD